ncbi:MAG: EF-Tu/IF-2/RF-3 family GTPase [Candidatus Bathyarchaeota archaeon]|uniref:EF-Tu/IF-2/RF-3 family GTPase n=1 Tax=Candidatus Bathycorpusculum sp. TaxID=2994959 RepID=UPI002838DAB9|nr:EF-Tu/IF-2/RF-3 family GTPase [Candidatus Termiticorpusculum sp.]MCL2257518.1 EF-Tu/IF-2/RF-3 family GTPase [Candidatus Termiticorpusculum sp.]MCL2292346.1 EF-Tu/IF-2/RF-3 family GTPase [Candidatus Termiticorpusculum sp.]
MGNLTVAVLGSEGYAGNIGKKGTATDIIFYNLKKDDNTLTLIEPSRYPERLAPLFYAVSLAKKAVIVVDEVNSLLGECLVMLQVVGIESGYFVLRNYVSKEKILPLIKGTSLENFEIINDDPIQLREQLLAEAAKQKTLELTFGQQPVGIVPVDHAFNVKGVGVVVLGVVANGFIQKHATLNVLPAGKTTQVRSIQKHDQEWDLSSEGDRVGLALKGIDVENLDRGTVLTNDPTVKTSKTIKCQAQLIKYWPSPLKQDMVMHIGHWTQFLTAKIDAVTEETDFRKVTITMTLDKPLAYKTGDTAVLMYLEGAKLRIVGTITID